MSTFDSIVKKVIEKSDIVLEIVDARFILETRNIRIERKIKEAKKILIIVINKCDFVDKNLLDEAKKGLENCVFVSAKKNLGTTMLRQKIRMLANIAGLKKPMIGVIGYPNVGKSSIINVLKGSSSARTSPEAGFTKGEQLLRVNKDFMLIDTPGVFDRDKTKEELVLVGAKNYTMLNDPELVVLKLMEEHPGHVEKRYGLPVREDFEATIEEIANKLNIKKRGNTPDVDRVSRRIIQDWLSDSRKST